MDTDGVIQSIILLLLLILSAFFSSAETAFTTVNKVRLRTLAEDGNKRAIKVEKILSGIIEPGEQSDFCHRLVLFGRDVCQARSPKCENCPLRSVCEHNSQRG